MPSSTKPRGHMKKIDSIRSSLIYLITWYVFISVFPLVMTSYVQRFDKYFYSHRELFTAITYRIAFILVVSGIALAYYFRSKITHARIAASIICLFLLTAIFATNDYYLGKPFLVPRSYWHAFAYFFLAILISRVLNSRKINVSMAIPLIYFLSLAVATLSEIFSVLVTSYSVFDLNDISQSGFAALVGVIFIHFVILNGKTFSPLRENIKLHHEKVQDYFKHPISFIVLMLIFNFIFMIFSSLLTAIIYVQTALAATIIACFFSLLFYILLSRKKIRRIFSIIISMLFVLQIVSYVVYHQDNITYNRWGLTIYKGIPIPFFDVMIFPNGNFRLVNKKHVFNAFDTEAILNQRPDIVIFGTGSEGLGGKGKGIECLRNHKNIRLIMLKTPDAVRIFNKIKAEQKDKRIVFILHNTC